MNVVFRWMCYYRLIKCQKWRTTRDGAKLRKRCGPLFILPNLVLSTISTVVVAVGTSLDYFLPNIFLDHVVHCKTFLAASIYSYSNQFTVSFSSNQPSNYFRTFFFVVFIIIPQIKFHSLSLILFCLYSLNFVSFLWSFLLLFFKLYYTVSFRT
jgi:hypothetical protein